MKGFTKRITHTLIHPGDGFTDFMEKRNYSIGFSCVILLALFIAKIAQRQLTGFHFNDNKPEELNVLFIFVQTVVMFILWVASNWAISTLFDGKAKFKDIWFFSSFALIPFVLSIITCIILSNIILPNESMFLTIVNWIGLLWSLLLLIAGMMVFHDYSLGRVIWSGLMTIGLILVIIFVCVLAFSLFQQVFNFLDAVFREFMYRL